MGAKQRGLETRGAQGPPPPGKRARGEAPPLSPRARGRGGGGAGGAEEYVVGQVAGSLWPDAAPDAPLARLFSCSAAGAPPALVPVTGENKKRKRAEVEKVAEDQSSSVIQEPPIKPKKVRKNELSKAEKELSNRESTLVQADEKEKEKLFQNKAKPKKGASHAITRNVANSDKGTTAKQKKGEKVIDEMVGRRTVFVGNLPVSCTRQALKSLFKEYGRIKSVRFRSLVPAEATLSKKLAAIKNKVHPNMKFINAYVVFEEECDAVEALKENGREIASGFHIRVDIASKSSLHDNKRSVFLGNLSYDISDDAVREHFSVCGGVVGVRIVRDRKTGLGKGFGYVLFENTDAVHLALKLNESNLMGRKIRVKRCGKKWKAPRKSADENTDVVHQPLIQNKSDLMGRKTRVKRCAEKRKAPQKSADENTDAVHQPLKQNESDLMGRKMQVKRCGEKRKAPQKSADENTDAVHQPLKQNESDLTGRKTQAKRCGEKRKAPQKSADDNTYAVHEPLIQSESDLTRRKPQAKHCGEKRKAPQKCADENTDAVLEPLIQNGSDMGRKTKAKHCREKRKAPKKSAHENTDAVHQPLIQNGSDTGRKTKAKHCGEKRKAPQKSADQSHPRNRANTFKKQELL